MAHITFIHGIANKPPPDVLLGMWERALGDDDGIDLGARGITSAMVYWADVLYPTYDEGRFESIEGIATSGAEAGWEAVVPADEQQWVSSLERRLDVPVADDDDQGEGMEGLERVMLPERLKRPLLRTLLRDVHHYLFDTTHEPRPGERYQVRAEIRRRTVEALEKGAGEPGPHVVVCHSMGTVIAYDCLKRVAGCPAVDGLMTIGSPLGLDEIPTRLRPEWSRRDGFPANRLHGTWVNVFDHFDPVVGPAPHLAFRYKRGGAMAVSDINEQNWGRWRHDISKYLHGERLRAGLDELLSGR